MVAWLERISSYKNGSTVRDLSVKGASLILTVEILIINFMEASVTYYKVHPFKVCESVFTGSSPIMLIRTVSTFREL